MWSRWWKLYDGPPQVEHGRTVFWRSRRNGEIGSFRGYNNWVGVSTEWLETLLFRRSRWNDEIRSFRRGNLEQRNLQLSWGLDRGARGFFMAMEGGQAKSMSGTPLAAWLSSSVAHSAWHMRTSDAAGARRRAYRKSLSAVDCGHSYPAPRSSVFRPLSHHSSMSVEFLLQNILKFHNKM